MNDRLCAPALVSLLLGTLVAPGWGQRSIELATGLERAPLGDVVGYLPVAGGTACLYSADPGRTGELVLRRAPVTSNEPGIEFGRVDGPWAEVEGRVYWLAPSSSGSGRELRTQRADGSDGVRVLSAPLAGGETVASFSVGAEGGRVLYRAGLDAERRYELFSVASEGGPVVRVNGALGAGGRVEPDVVLGPDGTSVYFRAFVSRTQCELFRGSVDGRQPVTRLNGPHLGNRIVDSFVLASEGSQVVYRADSRVNDTFELFVAPSDGSGAPRLLGPRPAVGGDVLEFQLTPDGKRVLVLVEALERGRVELWSAEVASGAFRRLHPAMPAAADVGRFTLSEDGRLVVFRANPDGIRNQELFVAPVDGSAPARRLGPDLPSGDAIYAGFAVRAGRVVYQRTPAGTNSVQIESIGLDAGALPIALSASLAGSLERALRVGPTRAVWMTSSGLESAPLDGSAAASAFEFPTMLDFDLAEDGERVLVRVAETYHTDLFALSADGAVAPYQVSEPFRRDQLVEFVGDFRLSPRGDFVVYGTRRDSGGQRTFVADTRGYREPVLLENTFFSGLSAAFTQDGARLVQMRGNEVVSRRLDGTGAVVSLADGVIFFVPSPVAEVGLAVIDAGGVRRFSTVPFDGSPGIELDPGLPSAFEFFPESQVSSDGRFAVLVGRDPSSVHIEAYRLALDGSAPAELLTDAFGGAPRGAPGLLLSADGGLVAFADVLEGVGIAALSTGGSIVKTGLDWDYFAFDPSGTCLVVLQGGELFALEPDGTVRDLDQELVDYSHWFLLDPTGGRVLIVEGFESLPGGYLFHLWSAPLDTSSPPVRLDPLAAGPAPYSSGVVPAFVPVTFTPAGHEVVFATPDGLVRAASDGSAAQLILTRDELGVDLPQLLLTPDSRRVLCKGDGSLALLEFPLSGLRPPRRLDTPTPSARVFDVLPLPDSRGVLFTVRESGNGLRLFLGLLEQAVRGAR